MANPVVRCMLPLFIMLCSPGSQVAAGAEPAARAHLRDPMQAPVLKPAPRNPVDSQAEPQAGAESLPLLASIRRAGNESSRALIDDQWLAAGAVIRNWRIRTIGTDRVVLQSATDPNETRTLLLHQLSIRRAGVGP